MAEAMSNPISILIYGRDPSLLETRRMLLETPGGEIYAARDQAETQRLIRDGKAGLLVLCYTLSVQDREEILASARALHPAVRVLALLADGSEEDPAKEEAFDVFNGPAALKTKVERMLQS